MKDKVTLYIAEHNTTGKKYFGKTIKYFTEEDLQNHYHGSGIRWRHHLKKHGDDVTMSIYGIYELKEVEGIAIKFSEENNIVESNEWANLIPENGKDGGGYNMLGKNHTKEAKRKNSEAHKGENNVRFGVKLSEETKNKIGLGNKGKIRTPEMIKHNSETHKGKKHSEETKRKMSEAHKGKIVSDETRQKLSKANKGKIRTDEMKKNISEAHKGQIPWNKGKEFSEESKLKMSESKKGIKQKKTKCPHCDKIGGERAMKRFHFDNCKYKNDINSKIAEPTINN